MLGGGGTRGRSRSVAQVRFHDALTDFLPAARRSSSIEYAFDDVPAIKDAIEALGVPHPEVDRIDVNGVPVGFGWRLRDGDRVEVWPAVRLAVGAPASGLVPPTPAPPCFLLDTHLGRLAGYLRMLGFDTAYGNHADDADLADRSAAQSRILLTRDRGLLRRGVVRHGYFLRSDDPRHQLDEIVARYALAAEAHPFTRCIRCNGRIETVPRALVAHQLQPRTLRYYDAFGRCASCGEVYWQGSHYDRMRRVVDEVLAAAEPAR